MQDLVKHLVDLGLPDRTIHIRNPAKSGAHRSYSFRFTGRDCVVLYHVLYDNVDESMYLSRKHDRFKAIADHYERQVNPAQHIVPIRRRVTSLSEQIARADLSLRRASTDTKTILGLRRVSTDAKTAQLRAQQIKAAKCCAQEEAKKLLTGYQAPTSQGERQNLRTPRILKRAGGGKWTPRQK